MRKEIVVDVCDRCPVGREKPSVGTQTLRLGDIAWDLELCADHKSMLERDIHAWGRLGTEREASSTFDSAYREAGARLAVLRTVQAKKDHEEDVQRLLTVKELANPLANPLETLPADAGEWVFTEHAVIRMEERGVQLRDALLAACKPRIKRPGRERGKEVRIGCSAQVVVNPHEKVIVTVAVPETLRRVQ